MSEKSEKFPDEDEDILMTRLFLGEQAADKVEKDEFEEFAEPFAKIEDDADILEISASKTETPLTEKIEESSNEPEIENANKLEFSEPEIEPSPEMTNEETFWEGKLEALKNENFNQPDNRQTEDFQTFVEPKDETINFEPPVSNEPINLDSPVLETDQSFKQTNDETKTETGGETSNEKKNADFEMFSQSPYQSQTSDETIRKSGLAYTAAIILVGAIVFTLILGWFADLLLGTSPWGKVGGIILGAIIGFIQFFRTTSQILKNKD